jgi:hypothetical protein
MLMRTYVAACRLVVPKNPATNSATAMMGAKVLARRRKHAAKDCSGGGNIRIWFSFIGFNGGDSVRPPR